MPATIAGAPAQAPSASQNAPALLVPFTRAAKEHTEGFMDVSQAISASTTPLAPQDIPAYGFMRGIFIEVTATGGVSTPAVAFKADAPFNILQDLAISDVNGAPIVGTIDGMDLYLINKFGGYRKLRDPKLHPDFSASTVSGNFSFLLYIPIEVSGRDALGSLGNMNAASAYKLRASIAPSSTVYSAAPATTLPTVRVRAWLDAWTQPADVSLDGKPNATQPPAHGTTSYWSKTTFNLAAGQNNIRLPRVGNYIRNLLLVFRDSTGARTDAQQPSPLFIDWDTRVLREYAPIVSRGVMAQKFGLSGTNEAAGALNAGVLVEDYCHEFDGLAGFELRDGWLPTVQSTRLDLRGNYPAAGTVTVLTNDVSPAGEVFV